MRRRVLSITIESFEGPVYSNRPLSFSHLSRRLVAALTEAPHHYELVEPPESLEAESVGAAVKQAVRGTVGDVVIVHVLSHGKPTATDDVRVVGADARTAVESSVRVWLEHAYGEDLPTETDPDLAEKQPGGRWVLFLLDVCCAGRAVRQPWQAFIPDEHRRAPTTAARQDSWGRPSCERTSPL